MGDLLLLTDDKIDAESINKAIINLQKQIDNNFNVFNAIFGQGTVDGVNKKLKWKTLIGTLDATGSLYVDHGVDGSKINFATGIINNSPTFVTPYYYPPNYFYVFPYQTQLNIQWSPAFNSKPYTATIFYYE